MKNLLLFIIGLLTIQCVSAQNTWTQKSDFGGTSRYGAVGFSIGTKGYIGTGNEAGIRKKDFWEYDPSTDTWTQKADFAGSGRVYAVGFSIGTKGYVGTGYDVDNTKDFWEYDPSANIWTQKADFGGPARVYAVGFNIGTKGYIGTGLQGGYLYKDFWEYDPAINTWTQKSDCSAIERLGAVGFSIGTKGYIGTGLDRTNGGYRKDFWEYDPLTNTWIQKTDFGGIPRYYATGFSIGTRGYIGLGYVGPISPDLHKKDFWQYDPSLNTWIQQTDFAGDSRHNAVGFSIDTKGYIGTGYPYKKDFWEYSIAGPIQSTATSITSSLNPSIAGQSVTFTATVTAVSGTPTGTVTFYDGTTNLGIGTLSGNTAALTTSSLSSGSHNITAVYSGSANYSTSISAVLTQVVAVPIISTTTSITSSLNPSATGQNVTFTATVNAASGTPAGTVTFYDGTTNLGTGTLSGNTATFTTATLTAGSHTITAVYNGISGYSGSTSSILTQVVTVPIIATTISLASSLNPSIAGQSVTFTATVTAASGTPTGTVTFYDGTTNLGTGTLSGNIATFTTSALSTGSHNITAVYSGNASYSSSTSSVLTQVLTVPIVSTTTSLASSLNPSTVGLSVTFTATVNAASGTPAGTVTFYDGTTNLGTGTLSGNTATLTTATLTAGSHNITALYNGNANYSTSTSLAVLQLVNAASPSRAATTTSIVSSGNFSAALQNVTFTVMVSAAAGIPTGTVSFFDGATHLATIPLNGNTAIYNTSVLVIGWHTITAKYNGDINFLSSTSSLSQTVTTITPAKLLHLYPNPIKDNTIAFQLNMEAGNYQVTLTNNLGQVILTKIINHAGGSAIEIIEAKGLAAGIYHLKVTGRAIILVRKVVRV